MPVEPSAASAAAGDSLWVGRVSPRDGCHSGQPAADGGELLLGVGGGDSQAAGLALSRGSSSPSLQCLWRGSHGRAASCQRAAPLLGLWSLTPGRALGQYRPSRPTLEFPWQTP